MRPSRAVLALTIAVLALASACGEPSGGPPEPSVEPAGSGERVSARHVQIYSAVVHQIIEVDNTFGGAGEEIPFAHVLISDRIGGDGSTMDGGDAGEPMSAELQEALAAELSDLPNVAFVEYDEAINKEEGGLKLEEAALVSLGDIPEDEDKVKVSVGMLCGSLCGTWLTYVVEAADAGWEVRGTTGPVGIS